MIEPEPVGPGEESVWDYPRPPRLERVEERIVVRVEGVTLVDTTSAWRVLETSHPPTYYLPRADVRMEYLEAAGGGSFCEWKGTAEYWTVRIGDRSLPRVGWSYPSPTPHFAAIRDHLAFYADPMDEITVGGRPVTPQPGGFYGGWITSEIRGPFKGGPGTMGW